MIRPGDVAALESSPPRPSALRLEAFHPMGTARMSGDPTRGVTAPDGAVRGAEALYVADASLLPTSLGVNPMMTVIACAASRIAGGGSPTRWQPEPGWTSHLALPVPETRAAVRIRIELAAGVVALQG